jgi:polysaccharide biosynthesis/export protein
MTLLFQSVIVFFIAGSVFTAASQTPASERHPGYLLGPEDQLTVRVLELEEFNAQNLMPVRIDLRGNIRLPIVGRIHAGGLTVEQLEAEIVSRLSKIMLEPEVTVAVTGFRSHPVSVLGAVKNPGVHQITGQMTLFEVLSLAGGLSPDAGNIINITRRVNSTPLSLRDVTPDPSGKFIVGRLNVRSVMEAKNPSENINIFANDVITVPKADLVYVIGAVKRSGGFVLAEKEQISVLQALSLAEGLDRVAAPKNARILRQASDSSARTEIAVNVHRLLQGHGQDVFLRANDILFIPTNVSKNASIRALETAIQLGTGIAIYRR